MNPEIVKPIRHRSLRTQKSSNPFATDRREPRNRHTIHPTHSSNPRSSHQIADMLALGRSSPRSISSLICLLSLISDFLVVVVVAWVVLVLLFSDFGLISDLMIFFCWVLRIWVLMNLDFVGFDDIFVWKLRKCEKHEVF